ncbi:class I SAM-dependent methyltransferase [Lysobacter brunescens]|uniref:Class I SAM-dependent methyltransferase n=1 Tax=Lysobacter brunescens TaxID=262323 RepID=A0ABW2YGC2_9GAMM
MISLKNKKNPKILTREWDEIAALREEQISSGKDHSANFVLAPAIIEELPKVYYLVDIGCGTGWLTSRASLYSKKTVGIDPSSESVSLAKVRHSRSSITYLADSVEHYSRRRLRPIFDAAISNMAASSSPDLDAFFVASRKILREKGLFIVTIPHPCFWPLYWGYASHPKFRYDKCIAVESEFKIRRQSTQMLTTHFHHPLHRYLSSLISAGFAVEKLRELTGRGFNFPRFMLIVCRAT